VLFETGYGPSGLPHIGTFGEVLRTTMVRRAFETISDIPTRLICFSDDMDGMRKIPDNVPNPEMLREHLQRPLTAVPDPFGTHESFGHHNNAMLQALPRHLRLRVRVRLGDRLLPLRPVRRRAPARAERYDALMEVMMASLRDERQADLLDLPADPPRDRPRALRADPPCRPEGGHRHLRRRDRPRMDPPGHRRPGEAAVEARLRRALGRARRRLRDVRQGPFHQRADLRRDLRDPRRPAPEHYVYELFLDERGEKISKSKGNGLTIDEWLTYASSESLSYFMYLKPRTAKRLHFDVIPKAVDEYHQQLRAFPDQDDEQRLANPVWHVHAGGRRPSDMLVPFSMLLNLASVASAEDKAVLWGFIRRYAPGTAPETHPGLDAAAGYAVRYFNDFVKPERRFRLPDEREREALVDLRNQLATWSDPPDPEAIQAQVYAVGRNHGFDPLRDWFRASIRCCSAPSRGRASVASSRSTGCPTPL
jgi:lysyl-tRNA synthetase, class I